MPEQDKDPFYVGYLPLPAAIKRFLVPWMVGNFVLAIGIAAVLASQDREPGDGVWDTSSVVAIEGELVVDPYPLLKTSDKTFILVEQGKIGVMPRIKQKGIPEDVAQGVKLIVVATGYVIERDGRSVFELDGSIDEPLKLLRSEISTGSQQARSRIRLARHHSDLGTHTLRGEIVDPKCYLGVMQPGDGKTHKVCATLCIKGGIPPMLLVRDKTGKTAAYLLTDADGNAFPESHYEYIADPIEITGQVLRDGDLLILRADLESINRLE